MGQIGIWQILIIAVVILVLFGRGRISDMMGDFGKGVSSFKKGLNEDTSSTTTDATAKIEGPSHEAKPASEAAQDPKPADKQS